MSYLRQLVTPCAVYALFIFIFLTAIPELLLASEANADSSELRLYGAITGHRD